MAAVDRLRSFYGDQLMCRTGTLASIKSFGSAASGVASAVSGADASTVAHAKQRRAGDEDVVIDPYQLDPDGSSSDSSDEDKDGLSRTDSGSGIDDDDEDGDLDEAEWTSASGDELGPGPGPDSVRSAAATATSLRGAGGGGRSVAAVSTRTARSAKSHKAGGGELSGANAGGALRSGKGVSIADVPLFQGPKGPRSVAASNWGARSRRSVATTARSVATSAVSSAALSAMPSGAPGGVVSVQKLDARLAGRAVRRRLLRRRGWEFDLVPDEVDYTLGRELAHELTRPQPTADSDEEPEEDEAGGDDGDAELVDARAGGCPPSGPVLEAIKSYAHERAPEVVWSERVKHAKRVARQTGQTVTVRGRLEPKKRRELARKIQKWDNREWFNSRKRAPPAPPLHPAVERVIEQWFQLVDDDGGGTLDREELLTALQASDVPVKPENIDEMVALMDLDRDGVISWKEFVTFFMYEFAAGKNLLSGEYVLPSGVALPFGAMIAKLKRDRLVADLMQGGHARAKWQNIADSPIALEDELGMMAAVELAMEEMKNPALGRARARAAKALNKLPPHLRTPSIARHLQRHPEVADKLLRAPSMAALMAATSLKRAPSATNIVARLASTNSNGSIASRTSSMAGVGAGSTGGGSTSGGGGGGAPAARVGNVDLNVAVAMAAGLEWPVEGASFYNKRAKTVLRAACQKPPEAILRANQAAGPSAGAVQSTTSRGVAARAGASGAVAGGVAGGGMLTAGKGPSLRKQVSGRKGLSVEAVAAASATAAAMEVDTSQARAHFLRGGARGEGCSRRGSRRRGGSESSGDEGGSGGRRRNRRGSGSSEEVLPWLVNAKRREEEERQELRERLMGGASSMSAAATVLAAGPSSRAKADAPQPRSEASDAGGDEEEEGLWVSPLLKRWLTVERDRLLQPSGELAAARETAEQHNTDAATTSEKAGTEATSAPQPSQTGSAGPSRAASASAPLEVVVSEVSVSSPAAGTPPVRAVSSTLDGELEGPATLGGAISTAARKPRRRMRFVDEAEDAALAEEEASTAIDGAASAGAEEEAVAAMTDRAQATVFANSSAPPVFLGSLGPHTCAVGPLQAQGATTLATAKAFVELPDDPSASSLRAIRRSVLLGVATDGDAGPAAALQSTLGLLPGQSPRASGGVLRTSRVETASPLPGGGAPPSGEVGAAPPGASPLRSSYGPALQQWALGSAATSATGDAISLEPLDSEEARELMAGITLQLSKEEVLYHIHTGYEADRPTTSDFRAALTRMRLAAAALVHSYALPPHPEASGVLLAPPAGAASSLSPEASRLHGQSAQPLQRSDSPSTTAALSARPSAMSVTAAHSSATAPSPDRARGRTHSGAGATAEGPGGGGGAPPAVSGRSRGPKVAQQVVARAPGLLVAGVATGAHPRANSTHPFSPHAQSPDTSCAGGAAGSLTPEASQPYGLTIVSPHVGAGKALSGWAAQGDQLTAPQPQPLPRHSPDSGILAAAIATARSMSRAGSARAASRARSPSPLRAGSPSPARGASRPGSHLDSPAAFALVAPTLSHAHVKCASSSAAGMAASARSVIVGLANNAEAAYGPEPGQRSNYVGPPATSLGGPVLPEAWDARVAALLQCHTAVELAAVQQQALVRSGSPDGGGGSTSARPVAGGSGGTTARASGLGPGAVALLSSRRAGRHAQLLRGAGSVLPLRAKSSLGLLRAADARGLVAAPHQAPAQSPGLEHSLAAPSYLASAYSELLPPRASDPLPDFIHLPGAMPRLQSRYTSKRPLPGGSTIQSQQHEAVGKGQALTTGGSRAGSRGGPRLPDPLADLVDGGECDLDATADRRADPGPPSPLWQDSAPGNATEEEECSEEPGSPRGWGSGGLQEAAPGNGTAFNGLQAPSAPVSAWSGGIDGEAAELRPGLPSTPAFATDANVHDGSRPPSAASTAATALRLGEHPVLPATPPAPTAEEGAAPAGAPIAGGAVVAAANEETARSPRPQLQIPGQGEPGPPASEDQASQRALLLKLTATAEQNQSGQPVEQPADSRPSDVKLQAESAAPHDVLQSPGLPLALASSSTTADIVDGGDKPSTPALARMEQVSRHRALVGTSVPRLAATCGPPAAPQPAGALDGGHAQVPPLQLHTVLGDTPNADPPSLSPYTGSGLMASGIRLPNPSRLKGTPGTQLAALPPQAGNQATAEPGVWPPGGRSPVSGPPVAGGQASRLVSDLAAVAAASNQPDVAGVPDGPADKSCGHTTLYLSPESRHEPAEQRLPVAPQVPMLPLLASEQSGTAMPAADLSYGTRAASHRARPQLGPAAGRQAGRQCVSESLPALPTRSLSHAGESSLILPSIHASAGRTAPGDEMGALSRGKQQQQQQPLGALLRSVGGRGSAPQPFYSLPVGPPAESGNHPVQPGRRRPAWGEPRHASRVHLGAYSSPAGRSDAVGRNTSASDVGASGSSLLTGLPDVVALLSQHPVPQRTGPIRIQKIDI